MALPHVVVVIVVIVIMPIPAIVVVTTILLPLMPIAILSGMVAVAVLTRAVILLAIRVFVFVDL